ncbi:GNAT family N-acetyltransferase [Sporanaerobium hydrogeniformans]|uniref:GNAT family N-acetyltransferase n=1 Tax=Sporanaerobium hydrogeniformans TaxID=3072179 RepID=A0AC61DGF2_9FIRM|nr:GNAT family N-acetyltransferase [Sporanaerobium hydrogeniformans]PHV72374.1 GNAT family N-acetyltransferase [Sporanaerobium hydrogeniformans]
MTLSIRSVTAQDIDTITQIEALCFPIAEAASFATFKERIETFPDCFFVAEYQGKMIGFINGCCTQDKTISDKLFESASSHDPKGIYQAIFGLDVLPEYRRQGVAALLMQHMIAAAKTRGCKGVILTCKKQLIPYYSKFGYTNQGLSHSVHGGATWYDMILEF